MAKQEEFEIEGRVDRVLGNNNYRVAVEVEGKEHVVLCHLAGKMLRYKINVLPGDRVRLVLPPPFDRGRITFRDRG